MRKVLQVTKTRFQRPNVVRFFSDEKKPEVSLMEMLSSVKKITQNVQQETEPDRFDISNSSSFGFLDSDKPKAVVQSVISTAEALTNVTEKDVGRFFEFPQEDMDKYLPEGLNKRTREMFEFVEKNHLMLRQPTFEILSAMKDFTDSEKETTPQAFVLDGERGSGKSAAITQIVQYARMNDWLVFYIPNAYSWVFESPYVQQSPDFPDKFDIDEYGVQALTHFMKAHADKLENINIRNNYEKRYENATTLKDLVQMGIDNPALSNTAIVDLKSELRNVTEYPVLIAVDEVNCWFRNTAFEYDFKPVAPRDISAVDAILDLDAGGYKADQTLKNGFYVAATTENYPSSFKFKSQVNYRPLRKSYRDYSADELVNSMQYYNEVAFVQGLCKDTELIKLRILTKSNPLAVFRRAAIM